MDISPKYIKMCKKAEEIQKLWRPKLGDFVWGIPDSDGEPTVSVCLSVTYSAYERFGLVDVAVADLWDEYKEIDFEWWNKEKLVWLPRQDQLQKMCEPPLDILLMEFWEWLTKYDVGVKYDSLEQLWLAYVMVKRYGKVWDDSKEEWIKEEDERRKICLLKQ